ncbi:transposase [Bradyrhizobium sp. DOA9]|uniref:transposase n=1 Tax=Bradyrhizobium sp. DOA9 TaxID=1126627 RepID=UPI0004691C8A|nr:transposase [Bradyrhizobium sp. DOA9]GAJ37757.1 transposase and inactivated derivatives [Bradyrhizobium sp. DOA9]
MAKRQRRSYSDEYKRQAVDLVVSSGRSAKSISKELGLDGSVLSRWAKELVTVAAGGSAAAPTPQAAVPSADQADMIAKLQRENEQLRMERDILKRSIAIFAGPRTKGSALSKIAVRTNPVEVMCRALGVSPAGY